ncbi:MAG TPA: extracellular solute-binding protein [Pseudolysinimonas sp.]|jgi:ABC-type glycerol-3-phosphate transport system substrate-binding protein
MKRRLISTIAVIGAVGLALSACSSSGGSKSGVPQDDKKPSSLTMLVTASSSEDTLKKLATEYTAKTGITIKFDEAPYDQLPTKLILAKQSNQSTYDMSMVDGFTLAQITASGALAPLDSYLTSDKAYDYSDFPQGLQDYGKVGSVSYGLPLSTEPYLQWYRSDLYSQLNLKPATTWADAISNAKDLQGAGYDGYDGVYGPAGSAHYYNAMLASMGGRLLDPKTYKPLLDSSVAKQAMKQYLSLKQYSPDASSSSAGLDAVNAFSHQQVGQMILASGWWGTFADPKNSDWAGKFATAETPLDKVGSYQPVSSLYGWLASISATSKHQKAAWDFLSWALGKSNAETFVETGAPPGRISTTSNAEFVKELPLLPSVADAAKDGLAMPRIPEMAQIVTVLSQDISSMASGQLSLDDGMVQAQNDLLNILVQSGRYKG